MQLLSQNHIYFFTSDVWLHIVVNIAIVSCFIRITKVTYQ